MITKTADIHKENTIEKVSAFITQERHGVKSLLVFKHPTAGIQIPAGSVEPGEDIQTTAVRETYEETGTTTRKD